MTVTTVTPIHPIDALMRDLKHAMVPGGMLLGLLAARVSLMGPAEQSNGASLAVAVGMALAAAATGVAVVIAFLARKASFPGITVLTEVSPELLGVANCLGLSLLLPIAGLMGVCVSAGHIDKLPAILIVVAAAAWMNGPLVLALLRSSLGRSKRASIRTP